MEFKEIIIISITIEKIYFLIENKNPWQSNLRGFCFFMELLPIYLIYSPKSSSHLAIAANCRSVLLPYDDLSPSKSMSFTPSRRHTSKHYPQPLSNFAINCCKPVFLILTAPLHLITRLLAGGLSVWPPTFVAEQENDLNSISI